MGFLVEWPFLLCILEVALCVVTAIFVVAKFEARPSNIDDNSSAALASIQLWRCQFLHPAWLCAFRMISFLYLLSIGIVNIVVAGPLSFVFYTQWTFTLLTIYFLLATVASAKQLVSTKRITKTKAKIFTESLADEETGSFIEQEKSPAEDENDGTRPGMFGYAMLIIFQMAASASVLTDAVYWFILVPLVLSSPYFDFTFVNMNMHGVNAIFLLVEFFFNDMPFPWFRGAYFVFWTAAYVVFQWIIHGTGLLKWWPYPFLEVSSGFAPAWYFGLAFAHLICFLICLGLATAKMRVVRYFDRKRDRATTSEIEEKV